MMETHLRQTAMFLAEHRHIHQVFQKHYLPNYYEQLDTDIKTIDMYHLDAAGLSMELPPLVPDPYISPYALYIDSLPRHVMLAHWFGLVYPYIQIPDQKILVAHTGVSPVWLAQSQYFNIEDDLLIRKTFEDEVDLWRPVERYQFFAESPEVYIRLFKLFSLLYV